MKSNRINKLNPIFLTLLIIGLLCIPQLSAAEMSAKEIMKKSDNIEDGDTRIADMKMVLIDRKGNQRIRSIKSFSKDYGEDTKSMSFFMSPADVRNTASLAYTWDDPDKDDDNWLYLPALRKVKRISAGNKSDSFMGSDFTYSDMNGREFSDYNYKMLRKSDLVDGQDCWVIESKPKKEIKAQVIKETGYLKAINWIRKDNFLAVKGKLWVKKGKKIKYFSASDIVKIQGIWTAKKIEMRTTKRKRLEHATVLLFDNTVYNKGVEDSMFTTQRMERGL
ncbi:MAG: outer membrane lipoprotein-sorting protein [Proteobacteria bacterium]|nr:outer membrane lipoprotein-sorting protein [Pseudomonadota bacterium]